MSSISVRHLYKVFGRRPERGIAALKEGRSRDEIKDEMVAMGGPDVDVVIHEIGGTVGADTARVDSFAGSVRSQPERERDVWVNGADALGFDVGLHPVYAPDADAQVLELQLTPPG